MSQRERLLKSVGAHGARGHLPGEDHHGHAVREGILEGALGASPVPLPASALPYSSSRGRW